MCDPILLDHALERCHPRQGTLHAQFREVIGQQPAAAAATEGVLTNSLGRHIDKTIAGGSDNFPGNRELATRRITHARGPRDVARVVEGHHLVVVGLGIQLERALAQQAMGELTDVLRHWVSGIQKVEWPD